MDKREKIINTAIKLFVTRGFDNTPTSQISKESGVATGTMFHHFKTKEELINEAYLYCKRKIINDTSKDYKGKNVKERLKSAWMAGMKWAYKHKVLVSFMCQFSNSVYITKLTKEQAMQTLEPFTKIIESAQKQNLFKKVPDRVICSVYHGIFRAFLDYLYEIKKFDRKLAEKGFEVFWDALKK